MSQPVVICVRLSEGERTFETWEAVEALVAAGDITATTLVCVRPEEGFGPARAVPQLAAHFDVDPWAAWDDADEDSMKQALEGFAAEVDDYDGDLPTAPDVRIRPPPPLELAASNIQPLEGSQSAGGATEVEELPVAAMRPMDEQPSTDGGSGAVGMRGRTHSFPGATPTLVPERETAGASGPRLVPPVTHPKRAPQGPTSSGPVGRSLEPVSRPRGSSSTRWGRLAFIGGAAVAVMLFLNAYVTNTATLTFPPLVEAEPTVPVAGSIVKEDPPETPAATAAPSQQDRYADLDREIRGQWLEQPREVTHPGDLEDALYVELPRVHIDLVKARAPITAWGGRKGAVPQAANFLVRYRARPGELDRELAAIGLLVGRYLSIYRIDGEQFTVEVVSPDESLRRVAVDPKSALRLYEQRIDIVEFLQALR